MTATSPFLGITPTTRVLIALDIDGTLVKSGHTPSAVVTETVRDLRAHGAIVVLATGRQLHSVEPVIAALGLDSVWVIASDGAIVARYSGTARTMLDTYCFDPRVVAADLVRHDVEITVGVEDVGVGYLVNRPFEKLIDRDDQQRVVDNLPSAVTMLTAGSVRLTGQQLSQVVRRHGLSSTGWDEHGMGWVDANAQGLTKASGIVTLIEGGAVAYDYSIAVGDFHNDIELLRWADWGVAMGQAPREVRDVADFITGDVDHDGVASVLVELASALHQ